MSASLLNHKQISKITISKESSKCDMNMCLLKSRTLSLISLWWRRGVAVERRTRDREVAGSSLSRALRRKKSGKFLTPRLVHDG